VQSHEEGDRDDDGANEQEGETSMNITEEKVLVVNKIASLRSKGNSFFLFSAVGSVFLFIHYPCMRTNHFHQSNCFIRFPASYRIRREFRLWSPYR
jgi:tRNA (guanine-N(7)-)-methyltransferase subunit TRM82